MSTVKLSHARYGKQAIRVFRIVREDKWHTVVEYNVTALLEGDVDAAYTQADNSVIVATDSIKNITYHLAKTSPHILHPERFALHLGTYFVSKYAHIHKAFITIEQLRWKRIDVNGQEHSHSFWRDGDEKRLVDVVVDASQGKDKITATVSAGISDLLVLKSTGSAFENFIRDEHTTLVEVNDRIFSTSVDLKYTFAPFTVPQSAVVDAFKLSDALSADGTAWDGNNVVQKARVATLEVFAEDESASVQATLYKMAERILAENKHVQTVSYTLPNKHYIPVDMRYAGIDNLTPYVSVSPPCFGSFLFVCLAAIIRRFGGHDTHLMAGPYLPSRCKASGGPLPRRTTPEVVFRTCPHWLRCLFSSEHECHRRCSCVLPLHFVSLCHWTRLADNPVHVTRANCDRHGTCVQ